MKKSERILLVISICMVTVFLVTWNQGHKGKGSSLSPVVSDEVPTFPELPEVENKYIMGYVEKRLDFTSLPSDLNDPFGISMSKDQKQDKLVDKPLKLTGIFNGGKASYALINGKLLAEGEGIEGWTVIEIEGKGVWAKKDKLRCFLKLHKQNEQKADPLKEGEDQPE